MIRVKVVRLDKSLPLPKYANEGDAGMDLYSAEESVLEPSEFRVLSTGIKIELPVGYEAQIRPRSGFAANEGISVLNSPGTIDSNYRGVIKVVLVNHGKKPFEVKKGDRIAQMVFKKVEKAELKEVEFLSETNRGEKGFGSTGK